MEIKKPSETTPQLLKTNNSVALRTSFQALLYWHADVKKSRSYEFSVIDLMLVTFVKENYSYYIDEIIKNKEQFWLEDFRWYRNRHDVIRPPKSSILCLLFCIEMLIKWHCEVAYKVIQARRNTDTFLDEYSTRWVSFSSLIITMEEEFGFLEKVINLIYDSKAIEKEVKYESEFIPKYSLLRMMWRLWGKYVMKKLLPSFTSKIQTVLQDYNESIIALANEYEKIMMKKYGKSELKRRWWMDSIMKDYSCSRFKW